MARFLFTAAAAWLAAVAAAAPSTESLNSSLHILIENDLQGMNSPLANSGVILLDRQSYASASESCEALGEQLWAPEGAASVANVQSSLNYLKYEGTANDFSLFYIAPAGNTPRVINGLGIVSFASPNQLLPVLCTQTAPFSNNSYQDTSASWQVSVTANNEVLTGFRDRLSFRFLGIRYAPQPERFTYSTAYTGNGGAASALTYGSECVQATSVGTEDCLFLNIFTPYIPSASAPSSSLRPVMFWMHGGAYTSGTGNDPTFDGGNIASRADAVVVAINYRLTTLGYLALLDGVTNGNYGLGDQINALDWVRANIRSFGGDPDRITIFGQSAGAGSVRAMMASDMALGKFANAIPLSNLGGINYGTTYSEYYTIAEEVAVAAAGILAATNCTNATSQVDCLRAVPAYTLANMATVARYVVIDGTYITTPHLELASGPPLPLNLLMGTMRDDGAAFISFPATANESYYLASQGFTPPSPALFPIPWGPNATLDLYNMSSRLATDGIFRCVDQATVQAGLASGRLGSRVYFYEFNRSYQTEGWPGTNVCEAPPTPQYPYGDPSLPYFRCHSGELYFVFGNLARFGLPWRDEYDLPFSQFALDSFAAFARTADPNPDQAYLAARGPAYASTLQELRAAGTWQPSTRGGDLTMRVLEWPSVQGPFLEEPQCASIALPLTYYDA